MAVVGFRRLPPASALFPRLQLPWWVRDLPSAAILGRARAPRGGQRSRGPERTGARGGGGRREPGWLGKGED